MSRNGSYIDYAQNAIEHYESFDEQSRYQLLNETDFEKLEAVLDVGCGAGQQLLPFAEKTNALCIGVDIGKEVGIVGRELFRRKNLEGRAEFFCARGEELPFAENTFDVVICRVALPYMNNRRALAEISRVLKTGGKLFLKTHAPRFYFGMIRRRITTFNPKQIAYPIISLAGGTWNLLTGKQPEGDFWKGKEIFQTEKFLRRELSLNNLRIEKTLPDSNSETPSYLIVKNGE
jgi:Methylase involved in ubiquinone/menaquinone biosynthesis